MLFPTMVFGLFFLFVYATAWSLERENGRRKLFLLLTLNDCLLFFGKTVLPRNVVAERKLLRCRLFGEFVE